MEEFKKSMKMVDTNRFFRGAARAATYNVILQVTFRLLTFVVNAVVLRFISRELLGIVNVRLTLIYSTILFLSRESFRKACLSRDSKERKWTQLINLIWLCLPIGILSGFLLSIIWIYLLEYPSKMYASSYKGAVIAFTFSAVAELLAEPFWVVGQAFLFVQTKVVVEGVSLACKCLVTVLLVIWWPELSLTAFCMAQLAHTSCYVVLYFVYFTWFVQTGGTRATNKARHEDSQDGEFPFRSPKDFLPCFNRKPFIDFSYGNLVFSFMKQSFLKQFLTEGERYLMTIFNMLTLAEQGVYDVINNLGSLVARFVFLPIEESYYIFFSQVSIRGEPASLQHKENLEIAARTLKGVLKFVVMIGCTFVVFGYSYSFLLLDIYGGKILSSNEGPTLLKWYCVYILVISINGMTECFMFALMSKDEVDSYNHSMVVFSVVFLGASFLLTRLVGSAGFIMANCVNMGLRITKSILFINAFFNGTSHRPLDGLFPSIWVTVSYVISFFVTSCSEYLFCCSYGWLYRIMHIGVGGLCLLSVLICILMSEKEFIQFLKELWEGKVEKAKEE